MLRILRRSKWNVTFLIIASLLLLIVAGVIFFTVQHKTTNQAATNKNTSQSEPDNTPSPAKLDLNKTPTANNKKQPPKGSELTIPELGVRLVNIPDSIKDLNYTVTTRDNGDNSISATISTALLSEKDKQCSPANGSGIASITKKDGIYSTEKDIYFRLAKQFPNHWIGYQNPQSVCSTNEDVERLHMQQIGSFRDFILNPDNIKSS